MGLCQSDASSLPRSLPSEDQQLLLDLMHERAQRRFRAELHGGLLRELADLLHVGDVSSERAWRAVGFTSGRVEREPAFELVAHNLRFFMRACQPMSAMVLKGSLGDAGDRYGGGGFGSGGSEWTLARPAYPFGHTFTAVVALVSRMFGIEWSYSPSRHRELELSYWHVLQSEDDFHWLVAALMVMVDARLHRLQAAAIPVQFPQLADACRRELVDRLHRHPHARGHQLYQCVISGSF
jgi:hypothetical protein